jgi:hypothetical protein
MTAQLKLFTDSGHASEVAHTAQNSTTTAGSTQAIGTISLQVTSTTSMPAQGYVDIDSAGNFETLPYSSIIDSTHIGLARATGFSHVSGVAVVQWYYSLAIGDQTNGILNDGTNAGPNGVGTNVATWYCYNAGDQTAQNVTIATVSGGVDTSLGLTDTLISITSATASFAASVTPANIAAGSQQQFWVVAEIASGQSNVANPQICQVNTTYQSI